MGHAFGNVLNGWQSFIDGARLTPTISNLVNIKAIHVRINAPSLLSTPSSIQILVLQLKKLFNFC
jgi:hypothetical protein